ncbi:unnamed protein product, partial [Mesorhabditis spiculigera]
MEAPGHSGAATSSPDTGPDNTLLKCRNDVLEATLHVGDTDVVVEIRFLCVGPLHKMTWKLCSRSRDPFAVPLLALNCYAVFVAYDGLIYRVYDQRSDDTAKSVRICGEARVKQLVAAGDRMHYVDEEGRVYSFGSATHGELGLGVCCMATDAEKLTAEQVQGLPVIEQIEVTDFHTMAVTESGETYFWGWNPDDELGGDFGVMEWLPKKLDADCDSSVEGGDKA